jgi:hypothetical protein
MLFLTFCVFAVSGARPKLLPPVATIVVLPTAAREVRVGSKTLVRALRSAAPEHAPAHVVPPHLACSGVESGGAALFIVAASASEALVVASAVAAACPAAAGAPAAAPALAAGVARVLASAATGDAALDGDAHATLATLGDGGVPVFVLAGGGAPRATLYAVTAFSRAALGAAFTLGSYFVPPAVAPAALLRAAAARLAAAPLVAAPRFASRGLFPWHDFTMGPDWLDAAAWQSYVESMSQLRFNTLMLHQYNADDHRGYCPQPIIWFGNAGDVLPNGGVARAYPAWQDSSLNAKDHPAGQGQGWARNATSYDGGAGALFPFACAGSVLQAGRADRCPYPVDHAAAVSTFAEAAVFFNRTFRAARAQGVAMAAAVGTPLSVPPPAGAAYGSVPGAYCAGLPYTYLGDDGPAACAARCAGLLCTCFDTGTPPPAPPPGGGAENAFPCRISLLGSGTLHSSWNYTAHPLVAPAPSDAAVQAAFEGTVMRAAAVYEGGLDVLMLWAQIQSTPEDFAAVAAQLPLAQAALTATGNGHVRLATGGWNLGPKGNLTFLDGVAAANVTLSSLMGDEGVTPPDPAFGALRHASWTIPWLEGDNGLLRPQVYVPRTLAQANASAAMRVAGNLAIHWRVLPAAPAATALALSAWAPNVTAEEVFAEFVSAAFALPRGHPALAPLAAAFAAVDDSATPGWSTWVTFDLYQRVPASDAAVNASYSFIEGLLVPLRPLVAGEPVAARALNYWIALYTAARAFQRQQLRWRDYQTIFAAIEAAPPAQRPALAAARGLPALAAVSAEYSAVLAALLPVIEAYGDIGVVNDLNQNTFNQGVAVAAAELAAYVAVPPSALPARAYAGPPHAAAPNVRTLVLAGDDFDVEVWVVDAAPAVGAQLCAAPAAGGAFTCAPLDRVGGQVFRGAMPPPAEDFDAYVSVELGGARGTLLLPPGAPATPWRVTVA